MLVNEDGKTAKASELQSFSFSEVGKISPRASSAPLKQQLGQTNQPRAAQKAIIKCLP